MAAPPPNPEASNASAGAASTRGARIVRHSGWLLASQIVAAALLLLQAVLITQTLGRTGYGVFALVVVYVTTVSQLLDSRIWEPLVRFVARFQAAGDTPRATATIQLCYLLDAACGVVGWVVIMASADIAARLLLKDESGGGLIRLFALFALINIPLEASTGVLRVADRFDGMARQRVTAALVATAATAVVCVTGATLEALLAAQLLGAVVGSVVALVLAHRAARARGLHPFRRWVVGCLGADRRAIVSMAMCSNLTASSRILSSRADVFLVGLLLTPAAVGVYELAKRLVDQIHSLANPLSQALFPEIARMIAGAQREALFRLLRRTSRAVLLAVVPACGLGTLTAPWLVPALFGAEFEPSVVLVQILIWQLVWLPMVWFAGFMVAADRARTLTRLCWFDAVLYTGLLVAVVPLHGVVGAAVVTAGRQVLWMTMAGITLMVMRERGWRALHDGVAPIGDMP